MGFRAQSLVGTQNAIGRLATVLASAFNAQHQNGTDLLGAAGDDFFSLARPALLANKANTGSLVPDCRRDRRSETGLQRLFHRGGRHAGALTYSVTRLSDGQALGTFNGLPITFDGVEVKVEPASGPAATGDSFLVQPNRNAARDFAVAITDPAKIAAGGPTPSGVSDGRNALALAALQRKTLVGNGTATLNGAYAGLVSEVGNRTMEVQVAHRSQSSLAGQVRASQQAVSGVNQDEETANLLMFQQMYQANAKVIQAASAMFDTILGLR